jgi:hypothetical protein
MLEIGMLALEVADVIRSRLGEPTVTALARRFAPGGTCPTCGDKFGSVPLSVRAYRGDDGIVILIAYHAGCATSAWLEAGQAAMPCGAWAAAITSAVLPVIVTRMRRLHRARTRAQVLPVMLVRPSLEAVRVRPVAAGEAVDADREDYCQLGFTDPGPFSGACRLPCIGQTSVLCNGDHLLACVVAGGRAWFAPVCQRPLADLITSCRGTVTAITCERDPAELSANAQMLDHAIADGELLLGWAPLTRQQ